ncbi:MAG: right-handed parallel beta-helix repeat-containing protein [Planctomycetes bacterium]|nr:right-handed parallel beta-helix repeat-containing protein [Planctomycetota bacterium]
MRTWFLCLNLWVCAWSQGQSDEGPEVISSNRVFEANASLSRPILVRGSGIVVDGQGSHLRGPGIPGQPATFVGTGITVTGGSVTLRNFKISGFQLGIQAVSADGLLIENCDASDNQTDPDAGWNDERRAGGFHLAESQGLILRRSRARNCWNGLDLFHCEDAVIEGNDFSHASNTGARLRMSSRNLIRGNDLSYGIRVNDGEAHARDSCGLLVESGSDDNLFCGNDISHGGNGVFVRISSGWTSSGNRFIDNDCSYSHNHGVECWSPGNTFIRNRVTHNSYGFWMGGADASVLVGNEIAWNGRDEGNHHAPEQPFGHGGIVFVKNSGQHLRLDGNHIHDNGGPGIVIRGHRTPDGIDWPFYHVLIQRNRLERNHRALFLEDGSFVEVRSNIRKDNAEVDHVLRVESLVVSDEVTDGEAMPPRAKLDGPNRTAVGRPTLYRATGSRGHDDQPLSFRLGTQSTLSEQPERTMVFKTPGRHRVAAMVTNGTLSDLAWIDVLATDESSGTEEFGTESQSERWSFVMGLDEEKEGSVQFSEDQDAVEGRNSLRVQVDRYMGRDVAAIFAFVDRPVDLRRRTHLNLWLRYRNPNFWGFQGPNPIVRLLTTEGYFTYTPVGTKGPRNLLWELPSPEGRYDWQRFSIPLAGDATWKRESAGKIDLSRIQSLSLQFDSWGGDPFTIWVDGLRFE